MNEILEEKRLFHETAKQHLVPNGFKRKNNSYYRFISNSLLQIVTWRSYGKILSHIYFDVVPICSRWDVLNFPDFRTADIAGLRISRYAESVDFSCCLKFLIEEVIEDFKKVESMEDCFNMRKKYMDWDEKQDEEEDGELCDPGYSDFDLEWKAYILESYPDFRWQVCDTKCLYAALQCGWYELAVSYVEYGFILRRTSNELYVKRGEKTQAEAESALKEYYDLCKDEVEIVNAIQNEDYDTIKEYLRRNTENNLAALERVGIVCDDWKEGKN